MERIKKYKKSLVKAIAIVETQIKEFTKEKEIANNTDLKKYVEIQIRLVEHKEVLAVLKEIQKDYVTQEYTGSKHLPITDFQAELFS